MPRNPRESLTDLLQRADALIRETNASRLSVHTEAEGLLYDIAVRRKGFEWQADKLRQTTRESDHARNRYAVLFDSMPVGLATVNAEGLVMEANERFGSLLGIRQAGIIGTSFSQYIEPTDIPEFQRHCEEAWTGARASCELSLLRPDGTTRPVLLDSGRLTLENGAAGLSIAITDLSPHRHTERLLKTTERDLQAAIDAAHLTVWEWDIATNEVRWSEGVEKIFGLAPGSFSGTIEAYRSLVVPEDLPAIQSALEAALDQNAPYYVEHRIRWPDGQTRWLQCHGIVIRDGMGRPLRMFGTVVDITDRARTEQALRERLAASNARLLSAQEEERRRLARELHDDHCQQIVSLLLQLEMLRKAEPRLEGLPPIIQHLKDLLQDLRYLVQGLHPPLLERQGLVAALRHHIDLCRARTGLAIRFNASMMDSLSADQALCLFRVAQEALQNIVKHAQATDVMIDLRTTPTAVLLTIQDNGRGYDMDQVLTSAAGLGLLGMRERVEQQHGTLTFTSAPGKGTTVTARLPTGQTK